MEELKAETQTDSEAPEEKEEAKTEGESEDKPKEEEDFDSLPEWAKEKFKKTEEDRDNYRSGLLKWKSEARSLQKNTTKETEEEKEEEWDEVSKRFKEETLTEAEKRAEQAATRVLEQQRERTALQKFHDNHPDLADDENWKRVVAEYKPTSTESTKAILSDLETAYERVHGKPDTESLKRGQQEGIAKAKLAEAHSVTKTQTSGKVKTKSTEQDMEDRLSGNLPPGYKV